MTGWLGWPVRAGPGGRAPRDLHRRSYARCREVGGRFRRGGGRIDGRGLGVQAVWSWLAPAPRVRPVVRMEVYPPQQLWVVFAGLWSATEPSALGACQHLRGWMGMVVAQPF